MNKLAGFLVGATLVTASIPTGVMALDMGVMDYAVGNQIVLSEFRVSDGEKGGRATIKLNDPIMKEGQVGGEIFGFRLFQTDERLTKEDLETINPESDDRVKLIGWRPWQWANKYERGHTEIWEIKLVSDSERADMIIDFYKGMNTTFYFGFQQGPISAIPDDPTTEYIGARSVTRELSLGGCLETTDYDERTVCKISGYENGVYSYDAYIDEEKVEKDDGKGGVPPVDNPVPEAPKNVVIATTARSLSKKPEEVTPTEEIVEAEVVSEEIVDDAREIRDIPEVGSVEDGDNGMMWIPALLVLLAGFWLFLVFVKRRKGQKNNKAIARITSGPKK